MRLTKHRQEILDVLAHASHALSAAEIHATLPHINLVTVYRSLEGFVAADMIKKFHLGEQEATYELQHTPHHHALCDECGRVIHFTVDEVALLKHFSFPDFSISDIDITVRGHCQKHRSHQKPRTKSKQTK